MYVQVREKTCPQGGGWGLEFFWGDLYTDKRFEFCPKSQLLAVGRPRTLRTVQESLLEQATWFERQEEAEDKRNRGRGEGEEMTTDLAVAELERMASLKDPRTRDFDAHLDMRYWLDAYVAWWLNELAKVPDTREDSGGMVVDRGGEHTYARAFGRPEVRRTTRLPLSSP